MEFKKKRELGCLVISEEKEVADKILEKKRREKERTLSISQPYKNRSNHLTENPKQSTEGRKREREDDDEEEDRIERSIDGCYRKKLLRKGKLQIPSRRTRRSGDGFRSLRFGA